MKEWRCNGLALALLLIFVTLLPGCATTPETKLYLLAAMESGAPFAGEAGQTPVIGLGPVKLPDYLDRSQIVYRVSENRLAAADFHRWAEPLAANVVRVLSENLTARFPTSRILAYPWQKSEAPDYQLLVEVLRFDAGPDDAVHLIANWSVEGWESPPRSADITVPTAAHDFESLVRSESEALMLLSRAIGDELRRLMTGLRSQ